MIEKIAVETLTLAEISDLFKKSLEISHARSKFPLERKMKKLEKEKIAHHKWSKSYEIVKGAPISFYYEKLPMQSSPIVSAGMIHRTSRGLILVTVDVSKGGVTDPLTRDKHWKGWVRIYTSHFCTRFAERIMKQEFPTFQVGSEELMYADMSGVVRVTDTIADCVDEIEFQFHEGQAYGYRDSKNKIVFFKTVYSNDMLKGDRLDFREDWKESVDQLNDLFKWK